MFSSIWHTFFYNPVYNGLVFFIDFIPGGDVGMAIILITVLTKLVIFPLSKKAVRTQMIMKRIEPQLSEIKEKYKENRQELAQKMMELYKENEINPLSTIGVLLIQLPLVFSLFYIFSRAGLPEITETLLYSFVPVPNPSDVSMMFLGFVDMTAKSLPLAVAVGITQYYQISLTLPKIQERKDDATLKEDFTRSLQLQMKYMMPVFVFVASYFFASAVALYWLTSNVFAIGQEFVIRKQVKEKFHEE